MEQRDEFLRRVRDDADVISALASRLNVPIEGLIDRADLDALCDSLHLEPEAWRVEDLETILLIRDGLYALRNEFRDKGDASEFSVDQLLSAMDRLYVDLERAMRALNAADVAKAHNEIAALQRTAQIDARLAPSQVLSLREEASELLTRTHTTYQRFEVNLIKIDRLDVNVELLRNAKLVVQRMSASVFAIKLSLEQKILFQGVFRFLTEGADKIVDELRKLAERFQRSYKQAIDFVADLSVLIEKGSRFTKHVGEFLQKLFGDEPLEQKQLRLKTRASIGTDTLICASRLDERRVLLAGRNGILNVLDVAAGKITDRHSVSTSTINCLTRAANIIVAGSDDGLETINPSTLVRLEKDTIFTEKIVAIAVPPWGIVSGTRDGILRRWSVVADSLGRYGSGNLKAGRTVQRMLVHNNQVLVASGDNLLFVDEHFNIVRTLPFDFYINDMCLLSHATLILCGDGKLAHINLSGGVYTRFMFASDATKYTCVAGINESTFCAGTESGALSAIDLLSSSEIGNATLPFPIRGIMRMRENLVAYGGNWHGKSKNSIAVLAWEEIIHKAKEVTGPA